MAARAPGCADDLPLIIRVRRSVASGHTCVLPESLGETAGRHLIICQSAPAPATEGKVIVGPERHSRAFALKISVSSRRSCATAFGGVDWGDRGEGGGQEMGRC